MKPNSMNPMNNLVQSPKKNEIRSLKNIPILKNSSSMQFTDEKINNHPRHISPFLQRCAENDGKNSGFVVAPYFKDDSDIRQVIEKIKRNENFENGLNYLTDFLEKHPGFSLNFSVFIYFYRVFYCVFLIFYHFFLIYFSFNFSYVLLMNCSKGFNLLPYFHECPQNFIDYITESIERIKQQRYKNPEKTLFENRNYSVNFLFFCQFFINKMKKIRRISSIP